MDTSRKAQALFLMVYLIAAGIAAAYLAAAIFFLLNKTMPDTIGFDTWYRYWKYFGADAIQSKRLLHSALAALALAYLAPLVLLAHSLNKERPLHGDARWATDAEIRKAGLL